MASNYKWFSYEDGFTSAGIERAEAVQGFLYDNCIKFEKSACMNGVHFEIYTDNDGAARINALIDEYDARRGARHFYNVPA